ncbi:PucR family transcriptional regulator [Patulibacter sp.]|uniref:PucR family transcriptional regulator n=1 Tax=Patulibacter sp. TaxID=1912859 RepID=UPI002716981C|nr:PucR family transcriptional regulator [Patulibacter sp.]MDO9406974.1 helix-turn-helix domain-containing protein [Patulibacter sp.]
MDRQASGTADAAPVARDRRGDDDALRVAVSIAQERIDAIVDRVSAGILEQHPDLIDLRDPDAVAAVRDATGANVGAVLSTLAFGVSPARMDVPDGALALLDHVAVEPSALPAMLRAYRLGGAGFEQQWITHLAGCVRDVATFDRLVRRSLDHVAAYVDRLSEVIADRWEDVTLAAALAGRRRDAALRALAAGEPVDPSVLDHPTDGPQIVVARRPAPSTGPAVGVVDVGGVVPRADVELADGTSLSWLATAEPEPLQRAVHEALRGRTGWVVTAVVPGGVGAMSAVAPDVRASLAALVRLHPGGAVAAHADVAMLGVLLEDRTRAERLVHAVLGPLAEPTQRNLDLCDTLAAYFAAGERKAGTAAVLGIHEKTVAHRLRRAEELLGTPLGPRRAALETALVLHRVVVRSG